MFLLSALGHALSHSTPSSSSILSSITARAVAFGASSNGSAILGAPGLGLGQRRFRGQLAPRQVKYVKRHKGVVPIPIGGSTRGTTLAFGQFGIRIKGNGMRLSAKQLTTAEDVIKRKLKAFKGSKVWLRCFPDIPVCIKGNETRMGKGKGTFEYWATRLSTGRVIFEIGGVPIREELAREILRQAAAKLPCTMEFITPETPARLGRLVLHEPPVPVAAVAAAQVTA